MNENLDISHEMEVFHLRMQEKQFKSTPQRDEIAKWIFKTHEHFSVEDVVTSFRTNGKKASTATIYRVVQLMLDLDLLLEHDFGKGQKYYEHTPGHGHHDHLICNECGRIQEFYDEALEKKKVEVSEKNNFVMTHHSLHIYGLCSKCK